MAASKVYYTTHQPISGNLIIDDEVSLSLTAGDPKIVFQMPPIVNDSSWDQGAWTLTGSYYTEGGTWEDISWYYSTDFHGYVADVDKEAAARDIGFRHYRPDIDRSIGSCPGYSVCRHPVTMMYCFNWADIMENGLVFPKIGDVIIEDIITGDEESDEPRARRHWTISGITNDDPIKVYVMPVNDNNYISLANGLRGPTGPTGPIGPTGPAGASDLYTYAQVMNILKQ